MAREGERRKARLPDDDSQFLLQFPDQRFFGPFARLDLAAGKFPQACHRLACGPLREQHAAVGIDQGAGGDQNDSRLTTWTDAWLSAFNARELATCAG